MRSGACWDARPILTCALSLLRGLQRRASSIIPATRQQGRMKTSAGWSTSQTSGAASMQVRQKCLCNLPPCMHSNCTCCCHETRAFAAPSDAFPLAHSTQGMLTPPGGPTARTCRSSWPLMRATQPCRGRWSLFAKRAPPTCPGKSYAGIQAATLAGWIRGLTSNGRLHAEANELLLCHPAAQPTPRPT